MQLDVGDLKEELQRHFTDGLAIVVGSGLSCAEGLSGMTALSAHLAEDLPDKLSISAKNEWIKLSNSLCDLGLEGALMENEPSDELDNAVSNSIISKLLPEESEVIAEAVSGRRELRFSKLVRHLPKTPKGVPVVTTNYDRLVEVACELVGFPIDTMFDGSILGNFDPKEAKHNLLRAASMHKGKIRMRRRDHIRVLKPHGSFDWFESQNGPIRFSGETSLPRLVVSPGRTKLRKGYDRPFDEQRETMNRCLTESSRLFVVGYGFNDDHLETHLNSLIQRGAPTVMITHTLSPNALKLAKEFPSVIAIDSSANDLCRVIKGGNETKVNLPPIWDLGVFVDEVLRP